MTSPSLDTRTADTPEALRARELIERTVRRRATHETRDDVGDTRSYANMEQTLKREYWGRFLIELLQNARDAWNLGHPDATDGVVLVRLTNEPVLVMLSRQPLRYLLADDSAAGNAIVAGPLMKELIARVAGWRVCFKRRQRASQKQLDGLESGSGVGKGFYDPGIGRGPDHDNQDRMSAWPPTSRRLGQRALVGRAGRQVSRMAVPVANVAEAGVDLSRQLHDGCGDALRDHEPAMAAGRILDLHRHHDPGVAVPENPHEDPARLQCRGLGSQPNQGGMGPLGNPRALHAPNHKLPTASKGFSPSGR